MEGITEYENLANAIIIQAVNEAVAWKLQEIKNPSNYEEIIDELQEFILKYDEKSVKTQKKIKSKLKRIDGNIASSSYKNIIYDGIEAMEFLTNEDYISMYTKLSPEVIIEAIDIRVKDKINGEYKKKYKTYC